MMEVPAKSYTGIPAGIYSIISVGDTLRLLLHLNTYRDMISGMVASVLQVDADI